MKALQLAISLALAAIPLSAAEPSPGEPKPAPEQKPQEKGPKKFPGKKAHSTPKPPPSRKDLAVKEARSCDRDKDNQIDGLELMELNNLLKSVDLVIFIAVATASFLHREILP